LFSAFREREIERERGMTFERCHSNAMCVELARYTHTVHTVHTVHTDRKSPPQSSMNSAGSFATETGPTLLPRSSFTVYFSICNNYLKFPNWINEYEMRTMRKCKWQKAAAAAAAAITKHPYRYKYEYIKINIWVIDNVDINMKIKLVCEIFEFLNRKIGNGDGHWRSKFGQNKKKRMLLLRGSRGCSWCSCGALDTRCCNTNTLSKNWFRLTVRLTGRLKVATTAGGRWWR